ncbi:MAG: helix-turn-helix transcriptional regulator [Treponema sp.]|nr:helix-turn-helix transcriptional regulator [Treponema sp.]
MIGERLQELYDSLIEKGVISSKKDFSDVLGIDYGSLSKYLTNKVNLSLNNLNYSNYKNLGVNIDWLLTGEGEMFQNSTEAARSEIAKVGAKIPLLAQKVSCGPGQNWECADNIAGYIEPLSPIPSLSGKKVFAFRASGVSMIGLGIQDGDILFFDGSADQQLKDGVYVFGFAGDAYCKLLRFEPLENKVMVYSVQKQDLREAELVRTIEADSEDFHIFGRVLAWLHENTVLRGI